jgi:hypothetical protein
MDQYNDENWMETYQKALTGLEQVKMRGHIGATPDELLARIERLKSLPGLHEVERLAINDALHALRFLEQLEDKYDEDQRRRIFARAALELQALEPRIKKLRN